MATPLPRGAGDEILSSPDPLNDTVSSALYPSSRRVTRSQRSQRLFSIGGRGTSPRKQMFELEVGDDSAPKRLLVTVEAEGDYENVGRRLFNADTPTLSRGAYTTTVPLAGDKKNTAVKTPARRGRPPKSGTPKTSTATKRKATSSPRKTPRQTRKVKTIVDSDGIEADITIQGTPQPTTRTRRTASRQPRGASEDPAPSSRPSTTRRRGRPKRVEFSDQPVGMVDEAADFGGVAPSDDALAEVMGDMVVDDPTPSREQPADSMPESEPDIWMQTMSDQATPRAATQENPIILSPTPAYLQDKSPTPSEQPEQLHSESGNEPEYNDYDFGPGAASDISSLIGEHDADRDPRDQDTVAQGEDFSMIFANSIPSMRGHTSMLRQASDEVGEETGLIINQTLESLRQSGALRVDDDDDDEDDDGEVVGVPTTQGAPAHDPPTQQEAQPEEEVEPHVDSVINLNAEAKESPIALPPLSRPALPPPSPTSRDTSPGRSTQSPGRARSSPRRKSIPLGRKLFENKAKQIELETSRMETSQMETSRMDETFSSVPSQILAAATPGAEASRRRSMANEEASVTYEDEFSEIPDAYLEAATPGKLNLPQVHEDEGETMNAFEDDIQDEMEEDFEDDIEEPYADQAEAEDEEEAAEEDARKSSPKSAAPSNASVSYTRSDSARMPTPDDTPSPNDVPVPQSDAKTIEAPRSSPSAEYSQHHEMSSDPPVPELTTNAPAATSEYITPVAPVSSPVPSPDANLLAPRAASPDNGARPALSPIVRAGRALQSVTSDASSPPRQNSLGSPFRPTTSSSQPQSAAKSIRSWTQPLSNLIQAGAQFFGSPTRAQAPPPPPPPSVPQSTGAPYEDPFGHEDDHTGQPSFMEALAKSMRVSRPEEQGETSVSMSGSLQVAPADEADEMSWMEEAPAPREQPFTQSRSMHSSTNAAGASRTSRRPSFEGLSLTFDGADETEVEEEAGENEDDDIWAIEASRPASSSIRQQSFGKRPIAPVPPRRAALPSPWQRRAASPENNTLFTPAASHNRKPGFHEVEEEDFSMLSQQRSQKQLPQKTFGVAQRSSAKKDLSAFFSSPALLPGAEGVREIMDRKRQNALLSKNMAHPPEQFNSGIETNSMFPSIPQKAFAPSASGRSDLFSPAKPSSTKPTTDTRRELFTSTRSRNNMRQPSEVPDSQMNMSSEVSVASVPQKNFTPNSGQKTQDLFGKAAAPLTRADIQKWQESSASAIAESSPESERRILRPLPDRNMSPTKSCLRSPLKPRTPGRVVEFTSSVLSPLAQAQARAGRRLSASSNGSADAAQQALQQQQQQQQQQQRINAIMEQEDEENDIAVGDASDTQDEEIDVSMMDAPDAGSSLKPAPEEEPRLSQTMWSRDHWLLLDDIIQLRRLGPKSGWLLGRSWHLDVVDAFKAEVGGWEEEVLAKRVFSLIVGAQLRKGGKAPMAPSVKFA
ncbi:hypothetical protein LY76DRAFT_621559 [Colletotrichum caudatum]|nr:hypothetical protein LY76DRAFT_621559 [Colletotrichum caudatum]